MRFAQADDWAAPLAAGHELERDCPAVPLDWEELGRLIRASADRAAAGRTGPSNVRGDQPVCDDSFLVCGPDGWGDALPLASSSGKRVKAALQQRGKAASHRGGDGSRRDVRGGRGGKKGAQGSKGSVGSRTTRAEKSKGRPAS